MEVFFLGVGEACDPRYPNTSLLVGSSSGQRNVLLDCGFTTPHLYFKECSDPNELEALWISHFHGDHFFGAPLLLLRFWEMNRSKPLVLLGPKTIHNKTYQAMDLAYPGFQKQLNYPLKFIEIEPGSTVEAAGFSWRTAENQHSERCLAVRITDNDKSLFYSGDGRPTRETYALARDCNLVIHEAFRVEQETPGHGNISSCLEFVKRLGVRNLALVHIQRHDRLVSMKKIQKKLEEIKQSHVFLPEPGSSFSI